MTVLDVGTGTGLLAREAARLVGANGRVVGIDPSFQMMTPGALDGADDLVQGLGESCRSPTAASTSSRWATPCGT